MHFPPLLLRASLLYQHGVTHREKTWGLASTRRYGRMDRLSFWSTPVDVVTPHRLAAVV